MTEEKNAFFPIGLAKRRYGGAESAKAEAQLHVGNCVLTCRKSILLMNVSNTRGGAHQAAFAATFFSRMFGVVQT
ncbi:hypothetical protein [Agathobaculum desmolans]|uniref:hypothetical protein n=1 Tax=Agathobaculum desmolans TaxID=39484 RepID=UPI00248DE211|nr:hypothetical protein [Agathobaculum desmolans]